MTGPGCWPDDRRTRQLAALRTAIGALPTREPGGWRVLNLSAYTAHAVFQVGRTCGVVVGTVSGWWWGVQHGTRQVVPMESAATVQAACLLARRGAYRANYQIRMGEADGRRIVAVDLRDRRRDRRSPAGGGTGGVRRAADHAGPADRPAAAGAADERHPEVAA